MGFYDLPPSERKEYVQQQYLCILQDIEKNKTKYILSFFSDTDTYIRKNAYLNIGKIYFNQKSLQQTILVLLETLFSHHDYKVRQTVINAAGEIGMQEFGTIEGILDKGLCDEHHSPRNAVIGSIKKMGQVNPIPVLFWAKKYLYHDDKEIRREICHGIELRGRTHPEDILPLLQILEFDTTKRVSKTLVHVIGQIAYKKGCLEKVITHLNGWNNQQLIKDAIDEIIDVHDRYKNFSFYTQAEAKKYIENNFTSIS